MSILSKMFKSRVAQPVQPGGHPTIPAGEIIAKPKVDGGYAISQYYGIGMGWIKVGEVAEGESVQTAIFNLKRPVLRFKPE
jgi:hypothetical protein